jgi:probable rRNA maturation factor
VRRIAGEVIACHLKGKPGEIAICFVSDPRMRKLNSLYLNKHSSTDVMAFDLSVNGDALFGDVVISPRTAVRNAREFKCTVVQEIALCVVHGILHLIGFNDRTAGERKVMEKEAFALLARVGYRYGNP